MIEAAAASVALPILGSLLGRALSQGDREEAARIRQQIVENYGEEALAKAQVQAEVANPSAMEGVHSDAQSVALQRQALQRLQEDATTTGLNAEERADLEGARNETAQYEQGQRGAILQDAEARGVGGSGLELAQQLASQQGAATRLSKSGTDAAAMAAKRKALANLQMGQMAGQFRSQDFGEQSARAQAMDAVNKFNVQNKNAANQFNAEQRTRYLNGQTGALQGQVGAAEAKAGDTENMWSGFGSNAAKLAGGLGQYQLKEDAASATSPEEALRQKTAELDELKKRGGF